MNMKKLMMLLCIVGSSMLFNLSYGQGGNVSNVTISIGAQNPKAPHGSFVNLKEAKGYYLREADKHQQNIDLIGSYGDKTLFNLIVPSSASLKGIKAYKEKVFEGWEYKNRGSLILLKKGSSYGKDLFEKAATRKDLIAAYRSGTKLVTEQPDYSKTNYGPSSRLRNIEEGDYVLFRSADRNIYAMGQIIKVEPGFQGHVTINFKIAE